jgi:hypothetical protein
VMDFAEGGDLHNRIQEQAKEKRHFGEDQIVDWLVQVRWYWGAGMRILIGKGVGFG